MQRMMNDRPDETFPDRLRIRDTRLYDDMGGAGQRIYTTAGQGYRKVDYVRADLYDAQASEIAELKEREIMRLAGISTAAQGYFKDGESIHPDYDTVALRDVTALYRKYEALRAENAALREGLPVPPRNEYWAQGE